MNQGILYFWFSYLNSVFSNQSKYFHSVSFNALISISFSFNIQIESSIFSFWEINCLSSGWLSAFNCSIFLLIQSRFTLYSVIISSNHFSSSGSFHHISFSISVNKIHSDTSLCLKDESDSVRNLCHSSSFNIFTNFFSHQANNIIEYIFLSFWFSIFSISLNKDFHINSLSLFFAVKYPLIVCVNDLSLNNTYIASYAHIDKFLYLSFQFSFQSFIDNVFHHFQVSLFLIYFIS